MQRGSKHTPHCGEDNGRIDLSDAALPTSQPNLYVKLQVLVQLIPLVKLKRGA